MIRIAVLGPESCGKSSLCKFLQERLDFMLYDEYAREYLDKREGKYLYDDLEIIAHAQETQRKVIPPKVKGVLFDTENITLKIWSEYRFNKVPEIILELVQSQSIDLYLLCIPDLPWEYDPLRENAFDRDELLLLYEEELKTMDCKYTIVKGVHSDREQCALETIFAYFPELRESKK